jgi:hypothetical protein
LTRWLIVAAYALLGTVLCWSRLVGLTYGYCCDEIRTASDYVERGPRAILTGPYIPNNHELFSMLGWATRSAGAESELALRLWSVTPFLLGVIVTTVWLHRRTGALSGILFGFLATASPLLLDVTRMARGYGLAFLAMSVLVVAALEAISTGRGWAVAAVAAGGLVGSLTLPHFAIAYVTTGGVLLAKKDLRVRVAVGLAITLVLVTAWYSPHVDDIAASTLGEYGLQIDTAWLVSSPIDQTVVPALTLLDDAFVRPTLQSLLLALVLVTLLGSSPLLREKWRALVLCAPVVSIVLAFWFTGTYVVPRFLSFLLVPLFMLLATGSATVLARLAARPAPARTAAVVAMLVVLTAQFLPLLVDVSRFPRDSTEEAALTIRKLVPPSSPVVAHVPYPRDLAHFLGQSVEPAWTGAEARAVCELRGPAVYVDQPYLVPTAEVPCLRRTGTRHVAFRQYTRGHRIDVWVIPRARS